MVTFWNLPLREAGKNCKVKADGTVLYGRDRTGDPEKRSSGTVREKS
jgi:hypothetical protein